MIPEFIDPCVHKDNNMPHANLRILGRPEYNAGVGEHGFPYAILSIEGGPVYVMPSIFQSVHPQVNIETSFEITAEAYTERFTDLYGQMFRIVAEENSVNIKLPYLPRGGYTWGLSGGVEWHGQRARQHTILLSGRIEEHPSRGESISDHIVTGHAS